MNSLTPKIITSMKTYNKAQFTKDLFAGIIVAIIALPLSIALAISSGVNPEVGIITAILGGFMVSLLGGSKVQIAGPTGAFMVIVFSVIQEYGLSGLILATIMAGLILMLMGFLRLGSLVKFIPYPIVTGFTSGIAVVIFSSQIKDFFGLQMLENPSEFLDKWIEIFKHLNTISLGDTAIGIVTLLLLIFIPKLKTKIPPALPAILVSIGLVWVFKIDVNTVGSRFGQLSNVFPSPKLPELSVSRIIELLPPAITIAFLGAIESLLSAVVSDGMIQSNHRSDAELVAQGAANITSGLFGGIPVTGAIARTVANIKNGGRTPISGMVHSITLLIVFLFLMPYVSYIPLASLAAILFIVAFNMSEYKKFFMLLKAPRTDVMVLLITFFLTVFIDLVVAVEVGLVLALVFLVKRMGDLANVSLKSLDFQHEPTLDHPYDLGERIMMYEVSGPFFFGATYKFVEAINKVNPNVKVLILGMKHVPHMDATAIHAFEEALKNLRKKQTDVLITGMNEDVFKSLHHAEALKLFNKERMFKTIEEAIVYGKSIL